MKPESPVMHKPEPRRSATERDKPDFVLDAESLARLLERSVAECDQIHSPTPGTQRSEATPSNE